MSKQLQFTPILSDAYRHILREKSVVSDVILREGEPIALRCPSGIKSQDGTLVTKGDLQQIFNQLSEDPMAVLKTYGQMEAGFECLVENSETTNQDILALRLVAYTFDSGERLGCVIRINPTEPRSLDALRLPLIGRRMIMELGVGGLLLVAGRMRSGKSTTMYTAVDHINSNLPQHILTVEDPIEVRIPNRQGRISQREVSQYAVDTKAATGAPVNVKLGQGDLPSPLAGVRGAVRMSVHGVMVMEIRDAKTAEAALRCAQAGLWVIAGLHAADAVGAIETMVAFAGPEGHEERCRQLSSRLHGVLYHALAPSTNGLVDVLAVEALAMAEDRGSRGELSEQIFHGAFRDMRDKIRADLNRPDSAQGILSLNRSLIALIDNKEISEEAAFLATYDRANLLQKLTIAKAAK